MRFRDADMALRRAILRRFGESRPDGAPLRCERCPAHKVIFTSEVAVTGAINAIGMLGQGPHYAYRCGESALAGIEIWHYTSRQPASPATIIAEPEEAATDAS
jgi:hypothetical protein